ncbi:MAG: hypothetical protein LBG48_04625 [Rickettsiales bacterium]|jgi:hypothetical protein|nr:hypothetical protein [Rickettsiales bacterium]
MFGQKPIEQKPIECAQVFAQVSYCPSGVKLRVDYDGSLYLLEKYYDAEVDLLKRRPVRVKKDELPEICREDAERLKNDLIKVNKALKEEKASSPFEALFD